VGTRIFSTAALKILFLGYFKFQKEIKAEKVCKGTPIIIFTAD
jgi:hypothetical protein|tara:strand:- start:177 stop:305 length:129 start_codon:yes stop_codon:yes gene_type:complete